MYNSYYVAQTIKRHLIDKKAQQERNYYKISDRWSFFDAWNVIFFNCKLLVALNVARKLSRNPNSYLFNFRRALRIVGPEMLKRRHRRRRRHQTNDGDGGEEEERHEDDAGVARTSTRVVSLQLGARLT